MAQAIRNLSDMTAPSLLGLLAIGVIAWGIISSAWAWYRLRHIPGPRLASFSHLWIGFHILRGNNYNAYLGLKKYGSLVRNGPNYLVTDDPDILRKMAGARSKYKRDAWYKAAKFGPGMDNMASIIDTEAHDAIKAKVASGYNGHENPDLEVAIDSQLCRLIDVIRRKFMSTGDDFRPLDFAPLSRYFTLDVITRLGYGTPFGHLDEGTDVYGWVNQIDLLSFATSLAMDIPWIRKVLFSEWMLWLIGPKATDKEGVGKVMGVTQQLIADRLEDALPRKDMIGGFIRRGLTKPQLEAEVMLQLFAGSDTTSATIRGTMLYIMTSPRVYSRLKAEIKKAVEDKVSYPITHAQAQRLPYLQAVIWEGYRMKCPVNNGHYKVTPPGGDTINGLYVPGGTAIGHNTAALTRKESIFGPDVDVFRPERFLECSAEKKIEMDRALDITFGAGRWMCAGKTIVAIELNKVFFELLRAFDFQLINPTAPWKESAYLVTSHKNMWVAVTEAEP